MQNPAPANLQLKNPITFEPMQCCNLKVISMHKLGLNLCPVHQIEARNVKSSVVYLGNALKCILLSAVLMAGS